MLLNDYFSHFEFLPWSWTKIIKDSIYSLCINSYHPAKYLLLSCTSEVNAHMPFSSLLMPYPIAVTWVWSVSAWTPEGFVLFCLFCMMPSPFAQTVLRKMKRSRSFCGLQKLLCRLLHIALSFFGTVFLPITPLISNTFVCILCNSPGLSVWFSDR